MGPFWFCKVLLLFEIESKSDIGFKKHLCPFVSVVKEYYGQRGPVTYLIYSLYWDNLGLLRQLSFYRLLSVLGFNLSFNEWFWQIGWPNANQQLSCSLKYCMVYPSHQYWADWRLCRTTAGGWHCQEASTFTGAACDSKPNGADGNRWWYVNNFALRWAASRQKEWHCCLPGKNARFYLSNPK